MHARLVQHLVRDPVAHPGGDLLVQQRGFDWRGAAGVRRGERVGVRHREQGVEPELADRGRGQHVAAHEAYLPEPARVRVRQRHPGVELDHELREARRPRRRVHLEALVLHRASASDGHRAGHAEVEQRRRIRLGRRRFFALLTALHPELPPHVLSQPPRRDQRLAHERLAEICRRGPGEDLLIERAVFEERHGRHGRAEAVRLAEHARRFHFGKLRHGPRRARTPRDVRSGARVAKREKVTRRRVQPE